MTRLQKAKAEIRQYRRLLMEADHVLTFAKNKGVCNERLKARIQAVLKRAGSDAHNRRTSKMPEGY